MVSSMISHEQIGVLFRGHSFCSRRTYFVPFWSLPFKLMIIPFTPWWFSIRFAFFPPLRSSLSLLVEDWGKIKHWVRIAFQISGWMVRSMIHWANRCSSFSRSFLLLTKKILCRSEVSLSSWRSFLLLLDDLVFGSHSPPHCVHFCPRPRPAKGCNLWSLT